MKKRKSFQRGISLLLALAVMLNLTLVSLADYANHPTHPTLTNDTAVCQINQTAQTVTFEQEAVWTDAVNGKGEVNLTFDGAQYVMKSIVGYDFALIMDASGSPNEDSLRGSAKTFVANILAQNPDAHFTIIRNSAALTVHAQITNNLSTLNTAINNLPNAPVLGYGDADNVVPASEKAYDIHKVSARASKPLMVVIVGDGDWCYTPSEWSSTKPFKFTANHRGSLYEVEVTTNNKTSVSTPCTYNGLTYYHGGNKSDGFHENQGTYVIKKDGIIQTYAPMTGTLKTYNEETIKGIWAHVLYLRHRAEVTGMAAAGVKFATICTPKWELGSYQKTIDDYPFCMKARIGSDEGYNFEITANNQAGWVAAFAELQQTITTKVVTMNTTIDNRYFTVNELALMYGLPSGCTYTITPATMGANNVPVQKVEIVYTISAQQSVMETVSVPVTLNYNIPPADFFVDEQYLPVVYDSANVSEIAGCIFTDLEDNPQNIRTRKVFLDASIHAPDTYTVQYNANGGSPTPPNQMKIHGVALTLSSLVPVRQGYVFRGWATTQGSATPVYDPGDDYLSNTPVTLYAVWVPTSDLYDVHMDAANIILRGEWANEKTGYVSFWISFEGNAINAAQLNYLTITTGRLNNWVSSAKYIHTFGAESITGNTRTIGSSVYSEVQVPVSVHDSGVSTVSLFCDSVNLATAYVITPGDVADFGYVNASDVAQMARVVNKIGGATDPLPGLANDFAFEMMDMTKDGLINASDIGALARIVNSITSI